MAKASPTPPAAGDPAPDFDLPSSSGARVALLQLQGKAAVLYFYPKDNTPGCTTEAREFRDTHRDLEKAGAVVIGVSPDSVASHCKFIDKYDLNFQLAVDEDHAVAEAYGVWVEKNLYGRKYMGIQRATFLIGPDGIVVQAWPKVRPAGHASAVLEALRAHNSK